MKKLNIRVYTLRTGATGLINCISRTKFFGKCLGIETFRRCRKMKYDKLMYGDGRNYLNLGEKYSNLGEKIEKIKSSG